MLEQTDNKKLRRKIVKRGEVKLDDITQRLAVFFTGDEIFGCFMNGEQLYLLTKSILKLPLEFYN